MLGLSLRKWTKPRPLKGGVGASSSSSSSGAGDANHGKESEEAPGGGSGSGSSGTGVGGKKEKKEKLSAAEREAAREAAAAAKLAARERKDRMRRINDISSDAKGHYYGPLIEQDKPLKSFGSKTPRGRMAKLSTAAMMECIAMALGESILCTVTLPCESC